MRILYFDRTDLGLSMYDTKCDWLDELNCVKKVDFEKRATSTAADASQRLPPAEFLGQLSDHHRAAINMQHQVQRTNVLR